MLATLAFAVQPDEQLAEVARSEQMSRQAQSTAGSVGHMQKYLAAPLRTLHWRLFGAVRMRIVDGAVWNKILVCLCVARASAAG